MDKEKISFLLKKFNMNSKSLEKIKVTTKKDLQEFGIENCPEKPVLIASTSGTTEKPTIIGHSRQSEQMLLKKYEYIRDNMLELSKTPVTCNLLEFFETFQRPLGFCSLISPNNNIDEEEINYICQKIFASKAEFLLCSGHLLPKLLTKLKKLGHVPQNLIYTGVMVNQILEKELISEIKNPIELYATHEMPAIAMRRYPEDYKVLFPDECCLEILNKDEKIKDKGEGILLITDYNNLSYPIIRFYTGDYVKLWKENKNIFLKIISRVGTYIKINGDLVNKNEITNIIDKYEDVYLIEVKQKNMKDYFKVKLKDLNNKKEIENALLESFGLELEFRLLEKPLLSRTNKIIKILDSRQASTG